MKKGSVDMSREEKLAKMDRELSALFFQKVSKDIYDGDSEWMCHANIVKVCKQCGGEVDRDGDYCDECLYGGTS